MLEHQVLGVDAGLMSLLLMPADRGAPEWSPKYGTDFGLGIIVPVKPGTLVVMTTLYSDEGDWGNRVKEVEFLAVPEREGKCIEAGADQVAVLSDPCYILRTRDGNGPLLGAYRALLDQMHTFDTHDPDAEIEREWVFNYENCSGLICSSGFGDGAYESCVETDEQGFFVRAYSVFIDEDATALSDEQVEAAV